MKSEPKTWKQWLLSIFIAIATALIFWTVVIVVFEEKFIFFPSVYPDGVYEAEQRALNPEDHFFSTADGVRLHAWFLRSPSPIGTMVHFHGNAGNLSHRGEILRRLRAVGFHVFIFDYRGYGKSQGSPDEAGVYADGLAAVQYVTTLEGVDSTRLFYFGSSLGGAIAVDAATHVPPAAMILESTFSSAFDVAAHAYPFLPARFFLRSQFDSETKIRTLRMPLLFLHGTQDSIIPIELGRKLFEAAHTPKRFEEVQGAGHNDMFFVGGAEYTERFRSFCLESRSTPAN